MAPLKEFPDPRTLGDEECVALAQAVSADIARLEAVRFRAIAQLSRHRDGARSVVQEVAFALSVVDGHAGAMVAAAKALTTRLPRTLGLMDQGKLSGSGAMKVAAATAWLSDEDALAADALLEDRLPGKNSDQIRKAAGHAALSVDRDGAARRVERHREGRRLTVRQGETGVASIEVEDGPVEKVTAAYMRVDRKARALKTGGETRTLDQLRADVALDLLLGGQGGKSERAEVFLYMDLFTYLGVKDGPAELAGHGHLPARLAREIATGADTVLRRIITDPLSGQVLDLGRDRYRPTAGLDEFVRVRDRECRRPGCHRPAQACDLDHAVPWEFGGHTDADELIDLCRRDHRLKDEPEWVYRLAADGTLTITTPTGQSYDSTPPPLHEPRPADEPPPF
ncbi:HNH endonuclease signature motif containing protein [Amycolatopsis sp. BJA-103]|uniref:HNH endonuclease signature motif containing protein n=1 Tax=Amycolatopsis sp. BJA-103 TaxID=1911175 RepID=UPI000C78805E|nr:HNH endonuclease signature motif containing protein [Amycolatopsis sp. BJA-103]AUI64579.1 HNH endonuclease [Amycolatopsis sp. BJA-103]PNE16712.1 HNH endonuclease [Amycolatopsis sp. BJA-103]